MSRILFRTTGKNRRRPADGAAERPAAGGRRQEIFGHWPLITHRSSQRSQFPAADAEAKGRPCCTDRKSEEELRTRRSFLEHVAGRVAGVGIVSLVLRRSGFPSQDRKPDVLATLKVSENKDLENVGGFVLVKDTPEGELMVTRTGAGQYSALSTICPHRQCRVEVKSPSLIQCPCHQSAYRIDGTYVSGPAKTGLRRFQVRVDGDIITVTRE